MHIDAGRVGVANDQRDRWRAAWTPHRPRCWVGVGGLVLGRLGLGGRTLALSMTQEEYAAELTRAQPNQQMYERTYTYCALYGH